MIKKVWFKVKRKWEAYPCNYPYTFEDRIKEGVPIEMWDSLETWEKKMIKGKPRVFDPEEAYIEIGGVKMKPSELSVHFEENCEPIKPTEPIIKVYNHESTNPD